jgi:hypothetical protein
MARHQVTVTITREMVLEFDADTLKEAQETALVLRVMQPESAGGVFDLLMGRDPQLQASRTTVDADVSGICTYCGKPHDECEARS